jgi:hypothetical protein
MINYYATKSNPVRKIWESKIEKPREIFTESAQPRIASKVDAEDIRNSSRAKDRPDHPYWQWHALLG